MHVTRQLAEAHYADLSSKPFFAGLVDYSAFLSISRPPFPRLTSPSLTASDRLLPAARAVISGPVISMVWQGKDVVKQGRAIIGATNPLASAPGTIRGDYAIDVGRCAARHRMQSWDQIRGPASQRPAVPQQLAPPGGSEREAEATALTTPLPPPCPQQHHPRLRRR